VTDIKQLLRIAGKTIQDRSPDILTAITVGGIVTTTVLAIKATPEAQRLLHEASDREWNKLEVVKVAWKPYIPTALMMTATIASSIAANTVSGRRQAALMGAYSLTERAFKEFEGKTIAKFGEKKVEEIRAEVAKDRYEADKVRDTPVVVTGNGKTLCYEPRSGRHFLSDKEAIRKAVNDVNARIIANDYASLNEFYSALGLAQTSDGDETGWRAPNLIDIYFSSILLDGDQPALVIDYHVAPVRGYGDVWS
jgi:hypothetical protein